MWKGEREEKIHIEIGRTREETNKELWVAQRTR